jgi:hypothetical protein
MDVEARVRQGVKAVLEEVLEEEMTQHFAAGYRELTLTRRGERNGYYQRNLALSATRCGWFAAAGPSINPIAISELPLLLSISRTSLNRFK